LKIEQAENLAMQSRWAEAADLNRQLIESYPKEVEAYNRLGKALIELGNYPGALEAYTDSIQIEPTNLIAKKNLLRLETLVAEEAPPAPAGGPVDPSLFIAETGRAVVTALVELAPSEILATVDAGDALTLEVKAKTVEVYSPKGDLLGKIEPKLRQRLIRLTKMGNQYAAFVTSAEEGALRLIVRETHRDPSMGDRPSFPTTGDLFRGYTRESMVRTDFDEEDEEGEEEEEVIEADHEPELGPEAELPSDLLSDGGPPITMADDDDDEN
jgi:tetratricopeptide (TPR) repeat protein